MEKYSRGRRGAPAKGVDRQTRCESSNLSFSAKKTKGIPIGIPFAFFGEKELSPRAPFCGAKRREGRLRPPPGADKGSNKEWQ